MTDETPNHFYSLEDLRVLSIRMETHPPVESEEEEEVNSAVWSANFYETDPDLGVGDHRILIGTLHAHGPDAWGTVTVGGLITPTKAEPKSSKKLVAAIAESTALESLYDLARITFKTVAGTADSIFDLPYKSPDPEVRHGDSDNLTVTKKPDSDEVTGELETAAALDLPTPVAHAH